MSILVTGANGQIGSELVGTLSETDRVIASDLASPSSASRTTAPDGIVFEKLDVTDRDGLHAVTEKYGIHTIYHLASLLSVTGEKNPDRAWDVNVNGLKHVLDLARARGLKVFWPSSIAVFGRATPAGRAPQTTILDPSTIYGVTKVSGEFLCRYYCEHFGVDVRSLRYPGLISYRTPPGGGTTDYAVKILTAAAEGTPYECFVGPETQLPMMYMPDAIRAAIELMHANPGFISVRTSYNVSAVSFTVGQLIDAVRARVPDFDIAYRPDRRQRIADSWPRDVDDRRAREDWGWRPKFDLNAMVDDMLAHLAPERSSVPNA
ncbi:MAG: NAD-dependent epimerase/dehydratase family protein [Rhodothermales bacterium]